MEDEQGKKTESTQKRLCSEIQLFDLCDLESCRHKEEGRFCGNQDLLTRFENITEDDNRRMERFRDNDGDESEDDESGYDDAYGDDEYGDDDGWEDE